MSDDCWSQGGLFAAVRFTVSADASAGLLPRLLQPFAKRDLMPDRFDATRTGDTVRVDIALGAVPAEMVHVIEGNLRQLVGVVTVLCRQEVTGCVQRRAA